MYFANKKEIPRKQEKVEKFVLKVFFSCLGNLSSRTIPESIMSKEERRSKRRAERLHRHQMKEKEREREQEVLRRNSTTYYQVRFVCIYQSYQQYQNTHTRKEWLALLNNLKDC